VASHNLTLSLDDDLLCRARVVAARQRTTVNRLVRDHLTQLVEACESRAEARTRLLALMDEAPLRVGEQRWTREDLHAR